MKNKTYLISGICLASVAFCLPLTAQTMPRTHSSPAASPHATASPITSPGKQTRPFPFHGMISAVDQNAKTFTIAGKKTPRVFKITDKTTITKGGNTAGMQDITENEEASGSYYYKDADGSFEAKMVKLGPMSTSEKGKEGAKKKSASPAASATASPGAQ
jgi:hypothetical protein